MQNKRSINIFFIILYISYFSILDHIDSFNICINSLNAKDYGMIKSLPETQQDFIKQDKILDYCNQFSNYVNKDDIMKYFKDFITSYDDKLLKDLIDLYYKKYSLCEDRKNCLDIITNIWVTNNTFNKLFCGKLKYIVKGDKFEINVPIYYPRILQLINNVDSNFGKDTIFFIEKNKCQYKEKGSCLILGLGYMTYFNGKNYIGHNCNKTILYKEDFSSLFMNINKGFLKNLSDKQVDIFCYKAQFNNFLLIESNIDKMSINNVTAIGGFDEKNRQQLCSIYE